MFLTSPTEVAKVRLQTQTQPQPQQRRLSTSGPSAVPSVCPAPLGRPVPGPKYHGPLHCLATVAREEGLRGLYRGSSALLFRDGHSFATYFLSYALLCEWLTPAGHSQPGERGWGGPAGTDPGEEMGLLSCHMLVPWRLPRREPWCPPYPEQDVLLCVAVDNHIGGASPGSRDGLPTLLWALIPLPIQALLGLSLQMSWVCWWPVAVQGSWPGPWPPPWT